MAEIVKDLDFWRMAAMGMFLKSVVWGKKATMYSYNGVVLPKLPEWDKSVYPYACICRSSMTNGYNLYCSTRPYKVEENSVDSDTGAIQYRRYYGVSATHSYYQKVTDGWSYQNTVNIGEKSGQTFYKGEKYDILWANYDVENTTNGTLYLSASNPIPVYE